MKITICGSSKFRYGMVEYMEKLQSLGHDVFVHEHYIKSAKGQMPELMERVEKEHAKLKMENDYIKLYYDEIKNSDAILVINFDNKGIKNYIGGNTLMEMGFAHVLNKKIYLFNPIPEMGYKDEIIAMQPIILNGNLEKII